MAYENITIKQFISCWFSDDFSEISKEDFDIAYSEYIDTTGLFNSAEFDLVAYIHYITHRINSIELYISMQKKYIEIFLEPHLQSFPFIERFGYKLEWNEDAVEFIKQLNNITISEASYKVELAKKQKELENERKKHQKDELPTKKESRVEFIRMINTMGKIGFRIDKNDTTIEELSLMMKQQFEEMESIKSYQDARR